MATHAALRSTTFLKLAATVSLAVLTTTTAVKGVAFYGASHVGDYVKAAHEFGTMVTDRPGLKFTPGPAVLRAYTFKVTGPGASDAKDFVEEVEIAEPDWTEHTAPVLAVGSKIMGAGHGDDIVDLLEYATTAPTWDDVMDAFEQTTMAMVPYSAEDPTVGVCGGPFLPYVELEEFDREIELKDMEPPSYFASSSSECYASSAAADDDDNTSTHENDDDVPFNMSLDALEEVIEDALGLDPGDIKGEWKAWFPSYSASKESENVEELKARIALSFLKWKSPLVLYCDDEDAWPYGVLVYEMTANLSGGTVGDLSDDIGSGDDIGSAEDWLNDSGVSLDVSSLKIRSANGLETLGADEAADFLRECHGESLIDP